MLKIQDKIFLFSKNIGQSINLDLPYFVKNGFWVTMRQIVVILSGFAISIAFARLSSQEILGHYQFVLSILSLASILSVPGLNTSIIQSVARGYEGDYKETVRKSFLWSLLGVPTILIIGLYYYTQNNSTLGLSIMIASVFFPFIYAPNTWDSFLQGKKRFDISTFYTSVQSTLNALVTVAVVYWSQNNLLAIIIFYLLSYSFFNIFYYLQSLKYVSNQKKDPDTIRYGFFLTKTSLLTIIAENLDKIIIGAFISPAALAAYYIISVIPLKIKDSLKPFLGLLLPKFSVLEEDIFTIIKKRKRLFSFFLLGLAIATAVYYFSIEKLNFLIFGPEYQEYYHYSHYYAVLVFLALPLNILSRYILAVKDNTSILLSNVAYPVLRITVIVFLTVKYSLIGAVVAYNLNLLLMLALYLLGIKISNRTYSR